MLLVALTKGSNTNMFTTNFLKANFREMVEAHSPVALKVINGAALVAIFMSNPCTTGSLREFLGRTAGSAGVTDAN